MKRRILFLLYSLISIGILILALMNNELLHSRVFLLTIILFAGIGLLNHFYEIGGLNKETEKKKRIFTKDNIKILVGSALAAAITWHMNHKMGYGAVIANGFVGVVATILFSPGLAGVLYTTSFIGMSAQTVMPSITIAGLTGLVAGIIIILSKDIYAGLGGKGGTSIALSVQLVKALLSVFGI